MDPYRTEEEQVEALKRWIKENGSSTLTAVAVALALSFGWKAWQQHQAAEAAGASALYQSLTEALTSEDKTKVATAKHVADEIKKEFGGTTYAEFAALAKARLEVEAKNLDGAITELQWVLDRKPSKDIQATAQLRLARVLAAKGEFDKALAQLAAPAVEQMAGAFEEVKGDIYLQQGKESDARLAYQKSIDLNKIDAKGQPDNMLQMKLDALGGSVVQAADKAAPAVEKSASAADKEG